MSNDAGIPAGTSNPGVVPPTAPVPASPAATSVQAAAAVSSAAGTAASRAGVDQVSGPTIVPEPDIDAQRKAWEDEQVPYDDATIAAYADDDEVPPFDVPAAAAATPPAAQTARTDAAPTASGPSSTPTASGPSVGAAPWAARPDAIEGVPQTQEEAKELLDSIFGSGVVIKPAE